MTFEELIERRNECNKLIKERIDNENNVVSKKYTFGRFTVQRGFNNSVDLCLRNNPQYSPDPIIRIAYDSYNEARGGGYDEDGYIDKEPYTTQIIKCNCKEKTFKCMTVDECIEVIQSSKKFNIDHQNPSLSNQEIRYNTLKCIKTMVTSIRQLSYFKRLNRIPFEDWARYQ